jgi:uncharacterized membrane protein
MEAMEHLRDSWKRSLLKTVTYRIAVMALDFIAVYLFTGQSSVAIGFVLINNVYTSVGYYVHERVWDGIRWGLVKN